MAEARQPVTIDGIAFDALISSDETWEADIPAYPIEKGFEVSDSIILKPLSLSMTLFLTNTPVTWENQHGSSTTRVQSVLKRLRELYFKRIPVTVSTSEKVYTSMAIESITLSKTVELGTSREIPISFREIRVTESKRTTIPDIYGRGGDTGVNAGAASTSVSSTPSSTGGSGGSILHGLASGSGLLDRL